MPEARKIAAAILGIVFFAALIGYSGGEEIPNVPKPDSGLCGVTKEPMLYPNHRDSVL